MRKEWFGFLIVFALIMSGCCPFSKKPVTKEPGTQQTTTPTQTVKQPEPTETQTPRTPTEGQSTATETEKFIAITDGELPPTKPPVESPKFMPASFEPIYFDFDKYNIRADQQPKLKALADYLKNNPTISILIEGYCDERGTDEYNLVLGEQRALSTRNFLIGLGISPNRLYTISYGEENPADPGHNEEAWAKNRRCEFKIKQ